MKKLIVSLSILAVLGACAPSNDGKPAGGPGGGQGGGNGPTVTPAIAHALKVGTDFLSTPANEILIESVGPDIPKTLKLYFKASANGQFNISKSVGGVGMNCPDEKETSSNVEFKTNFQYTLKTPTGSSEVTPRDLAGHIDQLQMKAGDELLVQTTVISNLYCPKALLILHAIFN